MEREWGKACIVKVKAIKNSSLKVRRKFDPIFAFFFWESKEAGIYEEVVSMRAFWENDSIIWTEEIKQMEFVIKDGSGGTGHAHKRVDFEKFFPTKVRLTVVQVSA